MRAACLSRRETKRRMMNGDSNAFVSYASPIAFGAVVGDAQHLAIFG